MARTGASRLAAGASMFRREPGVPLMLVVASLPA